MHLRRWRAWRRLWERVRRWRGLGVEDGYGRRGEREPRWGLWGEGVGDMGRRWCAWRRPGERERRCRGLGVGFAYRGRGEREARWGSWGEGVVDMGRRWRSWWRLGEQSGGSGAPGGSSGALGSGSGASEWLRGGGGVGSVSAGGGCALRGGSRSAAVCGTRPRRSSRATQEVSAGSWGPGAALPGTGEGGEVLRPPWIRHVGMRRRQRLVVCIESLSLVGLGPGGPFWLDVVAGGIQCLCTGGVAPGGRWGMGVERPVAAIPYAGAAPARGVVARWGRVVGSGSAGGGVVGGGGGAAGGGGAGSGGAGTVGMARGPLVDIPVLLPGMGSRASCVVPGAVLVGGRRGRVRGRA